MPEKVKKYPKLDFLVYLLDFFGHFRGLFCGPPKRLFLRLFCDFGPGGPGDSCKWSLGSQIYVISWLSMLSWAQMARPLVNQLGGGMGAERKQHANFARRRPPHCQGMSRGSCNCSILGAAVVCCELHWNPHTKSLLSAELHGHPGRLCGILGLIFLNDFCHVRTAHTPESRVAASDRVVGLKRRFKALERVGPETLY